jgi:nuclear pore complex protein Nup133
MLSLAKLAVLASDEQPDKVEEQVNSLNTDLDLVSYQEELPEVVLSSYGYDVERLRVLTPAEIIKVRGQEFMEMQSISQLKMMPACDVIVACPVIKSVINTSRR